MPKLSWIEMRAISKTRILGTALNIYGSKKSGASLGGRQLLLLVPRPSFLA
jgi:hypothetical protein